MDIIYDFLRKKRIITTLMSLLAVLPVISAGHFHNVDVKDGLADNFVRDIWTDSEGYVWFSTINGLSRYDGYRFLNFQPQQWGARSGDVTMVRETADKTLWMLCSGELFTYNRSEQTWKKDGIERLREKGIREDSISKFFVDNNGDFWTVAGRWLYHQDYRNARLIRIDCQGLAPILHIVTKNNTTLVITSTYYIYKVNRNNRLSMLTQHPTPKSVSRDSHAMIDGKMNLWLYTRHALAGSLWIYSLENGQWRQPNTLRQMDSNVTVNVIAEDRDGRLWIGTGNHGIRVIDRNGGTDVKNAFQSMNSHITCLYADSNNTMWAGSAKLGAAYTDLNCPEFIHVSTNGHDDVSALMEDAQGNLWIGLDGEGVMMREKGDATVHTFTTRNGQLPSDNITTLSTDAQGNILVGTYGGGIARLDGKRFVPLFSDYDQLRYVKAIATDRHGSLWVATVDKGVVRITDNRLTHFNTRNSTLRSDGIICLAYDELDDRIYIGTSVGLAAYDCSRGRFIEKDTVLDSLKNINVTALLVEDVRKEDDKKVNIGSQLWIGSRNGLWIKGRKLLRITTEQGLSHNVVRALARSHGTIWASTDNGLTSITAADNAHESESTATEGTQVYRCRPFFDSDGLHGIIFSNNAAWTKSDGNVLLGSLTGYVSIPLESDNSTISMSLPHPNLHVAFTEFRINGNPVVKAPQGFTINYGEHLGISISMMVPALSHKARYLYRFKGEDKWMRAPTNMLYFASLMPGTHVLQVKAELTGLTTTKVSELSFKVKPPLWFSRQAVVCYILLLAAAIWLITRAVRKRQKRELAIKQMELNLKKYEMEEQKISFFTNISHDIKTPLTMVMAPLEKILGTNLPSAVRTEINVAWQNAQQLYNLVIELLDFRRLDEGKEKLNLSHGELVSFVQQTTQNFSHLATHKNITMELRMPATPIEMLFDENKIRRIITNLLSNAFKYNIEGGSVIVTLEHHDGEVTLCIADTGIGIKDKHHVFDRFMQETHGQEQEGSGLGLYIVRQYVDMMDGSITITDNQPQGTVFTVTLKASPDQSKGNDAGLCHSITLSNQIPPIGEGRENADTLLVVEDNTDARNFLQRSLKDEYHVLLAANGEEALDQLAQNPNISIIVSDVMMPVMDGMELVRQIRKDIRYSHIPIILLTAKSNEEDIVAGLQEGVADYLTKPFSLAVLRLRIQKIIEWTRHVHEQVANGIEIMPSEITVSSIDEELISHVISEVEANISDPDYSVVQLSTAVGMTRGTLYKKLMAIVGKSPVEFIRIVRLKRGKSLLDQGRTNISEVADKVGYSPKMFARYFREMYGNTPSDYLKQRN